MQKTLRNSVIKKFAASQQIHQQRGQKIVILEQLQKQLSALPLKGTSSINLDVNDINDDLECTDTISKIIEVFGKKFLFLTFLSIISYSLAKANRKFLSCLILSSNKLSSKSIEYLSQTTFNYLTYLDLPNNRLSSKSMKYLSQFTFNFLKQFDVSWNRIKNKGLKYLCSIKFVELRTLSCIKNQFTLDGIKSFARHHIKNIESFVSNFLVECICEVRVLLLVHSKRIWCNLAVLEKYIRSLLFTNEVAKVKSLVQMQSESYNIRQSIIEKFRFKLA